MDSANPNFSSDEKGVLFNKDKTALILAPFCIEEYTISKETKIIGKGAFKGNHLEKIKFSEGLETIESLAFAFCRELESILIPESVKQIDDGAFIYCTNIDGVWVDKKNPYYCNDFYGTLFSKDKTMLLQAPYWNNTLHYMIPDTVEIIGGSAFEGDENLVDINIPANVKLIKEAAFATCTNLSEIYFLGEKPQIEKECFYNVNAIVYYLNGKHTWKKGDFQDYSGNLVWKEIEITDFTDYMIKKMAEILSIRDVFLSLW